MSRLPRIDSRLAAPFVLGVALSASTAHGYPSRPLNPSEARGKVIYIEGASPSGAVITSRFGAEALELPGTASTCGSCHGPDGTGRPESGVVPTNIRWANLTKSYGHVHESGLSHPPFDEESLAAYLASGDYPGGSRGDPAMPRYDMTPADLADLIAYLRRLGDELGPGVEDTRLRVGTILPVDGMPGRVIRDVLGAYFDAVNAEGGIYGREIVLTVGAFPDGVGGAPPLEAASQWLDEEEPFLLVSTFTPGWEAELQEILAARRVPLIGPFTLRPVTSYALNRDVYYLLAGLAEQVRALLLFDGERNPTPARTAVLVPDGVPLDDVVEVVETSGRAAIRTFAERTTDWGAVVEDLRDRSTERVIHLGAESAIDSFLRAAAEHGFTPRVLASGALAGGVVGRAPEPFRGRLFLAYPSVPSDRKAWAARELSRLAAAGSGPSQAAVSSYAAAKIAVEALRRSGKSLSRIGLAESLATFYEFDTGLTPPISFDRNRRMGAGGSYVLVVDDTARGPGRAPGPIVWVSLE